MSYYCPICRQKTKQTLYITKKFINYTAEFFRCNKCLALLEPRAIQNPYEYTKEPCDDLNWYSELNYGLLFFVFLDRFIEKIYRFYKQQGLKKITICDFGGGYDYLSYFLKLKYKNIDIFCLEANPNQINFNRKYLNVPSYTYKNAIKKYKNKVNIIIASEVVEHFTNPYEFKKTLEKLLNKNNNFCILTTPNSLSTDIKIKKENFVYLGAPGLHCILHSKKSLDKVFFSYKTKLIFPTEGKYGEERLIGLISKHKLPDSLKNYFISYTNFIPGNNKEILKEAVRWVERLKNNELFKPFYYGSLLKAAKILTNLGEYEKAILIYQKIEREYLGINYFNILLSKLKLLKKEKNIFSLTNKIKPLSVDFYLDYGFTLLLSGKNEKAINYISKSYKIHKIIATYNKIPYTAEEFKLERSLLYRGILFYRNKSYLKALKVFDELNKVFHFLDTELQWNVFINRLNCLVDLKKITEAVNYIDEHLNDEFIKKINKSRKKEIFKSIYRLFLNITFDNLALIKLIKAIIKLNFF